MILKKAGLFNIDKLRTLCLFQCDHNHNNKFLGGQMMNHAMKHGHIAEEQYSVPGKRSILHALNKTLYFDNIRYGKHSACLTSCDLKSCYNRFAHSPAMLAARSFGVPKEPLISFFATLQEVQYHTRTVYGVSTETFGGANEKFSNNPQGSGQGNGAAPQLWAIVSSKMFHMLHTLGLASVIITPISGTSMSIVGFAYVDDSDLIAYSQQHDIASTVKQMQKIINAWECAAKVTGGAIAPLKCWWYLVAFEWDDNNNWHYSKTTNYLLTAKDANDTVQPLPLLQPDEAQEMLGVFISPSGENKAQVNSLMKKAKEYSDKVRTCPTFRHEAWIGLTNVAMKSLDYCLPATTLTKAECDNITWQLLKAFLTKSGINRFIKRDVLFASVGAQGLGLKNLFLTQGISHISDLIENIWKDSITRKLQRASLEYMRLELGVNRNILNSDYNQLAWLVLTPSWMEHTWRFMSLHKITIDYDVPTIPMLRENDKPLMEILIQDKSFTKHEIQVVNKCRLYLQVFSLSDMTTGCGKYVRDGIWNCVRDHHNKSNSLQWPLYPPPRKSMLNIWQSVIRRALCLHKFKTLDTPLGAWKQVPSYRSVAIIFSSGLS